jgi:hypothetical protein
MLDDNMIRLGLRGGCDWSDRCVLGLGGSSGDGFWGHEWRRLNGNGRWFRRRLCIQWVVGFVWLIFVGFGFEGWF